MNPELNETHSPHRDGFTNWMRLRQSSILYLLGISRHESDVLSSLPTDLSDCNSYSEIIGIVFRMYSIESSLYRNINHFLRRFPVEIASKLMKELDGMLCYIYLLQSSINQFSLRSPIKCDLVVYRGFSSDGPNQAQLYESMIGEIVIWRGFTSTSLDRECVISSFVGGSAGLLFEITLHPGDVAASISGYSGHSSESEVLIAASTGFLVESVEWIEVENHETSDVFTIPRVKLNYFLSWYDFDLDRPPPRLIL
jgi:hypothetical protein